MQPHVSAITLGVRDLDRAKRFYAGLGWPVEQDFELWVSFALDGGSVVLGLYPWEALAEDAGVPPEGSGFRGIALNYLVSSENRVGEVLGEAERAGGTIVKPVQGAPWGGAFGYFSDPDGYLWKVAASTSPQRSAAE